MSIPKLLNDFLIYLTTITGKSQRTRNEYKYDLVLFLQFQKAIQENSEFTELNKIDISDITIENIQTITIEDLYFFMEFCEEVRKNSASSRARKGSAIKSFFKYLKNKRRLLDYNPAEELETPKLKKRTPTYLTLDESRALLEAAAASSVRDHAMVTLFLNLGVRVSEICALNLTSIEGATVKIVGKGDKERIVYLNDACIKALDSYLPVRYPYKGEGIEPLFTTKNNTRITRQAVAQLIQKLRIAASLEYKKITPHKLRHTSATLLYQAGTDIRTLQEILGHTSVSTTQIYAHIDNKSIKDALHSNPLNGN